MAEHKWECFKCNMVITTSSSVTPDKKAGGSCHKSNDGNHSWHSKN